MIRYFLRGLRQHVRSGRGLFALTVIGVALGVASVVSIQILHLNALGAFTGSMRAVSGAADLSVLGTGPVLSEESFVVVLGTPGVASASPLYRVDVALASPGEEIRLEVLGIDPVTAIESPPWQGEEGGELSDMWSEPGWIALTPELAERAALEPGESFEVSVGSRRATLRLAALVDFRRASPLASSRLAVMDIAQAQDLLGRSGEIHQIDVGLEAGVDRDRVARELAARLGSAARVATPEDRERQTADLLSSFRLNLTALSLISLLVGWFLVYSSTQASLVRRRMELGLLRSLGATRAQVWGLLLGETLALAALGVALGLPLGYLAARAYVDRVSAMLTNVYVLSEIETLSLPGWLFPLAAAIGAAGAAAGAFWPALEASRRETRSLLAPFTLHERMGRAAFPLFVSGVLLLGGVAALAALAGEDWGPGGFVLALGLLAGFSLATPLLVQRAARRIRVKRFGFLYGWRGLGLQLQTTPFAIAALAVAVSMLVAVTIMVGSFRRTLEVWVDETVRADVYVAAASWRPGNREAHLDPELVSALADRPGVAAIDRLRQFFLHLGDRRVTVSGVDASLPPDRRRFAFLAGEPAEAYRRLREKAAVLIGEPLARKAGLGPGDRLLLPTPSGEEASFPVAGVYYDYRGDAGSVVMSLETMARHFGPGPVSNVALYLEPGVDAGRFVGRLEAELSGVPIEIRSNADLRRRIFSIFDQTFAVTRLLEILSLLIAVCGITLALLVLARERVSELALYRALGADRAQIFRTYLGKGMGMASFGIVLGGTAGVLLALILIFRINRAYFGWTIALAWPWSALLGEAAVILGASFLASIYPALRASKTPAMELRRDDL